MGSSMGFFEYVSVNKALIVSLLFDHIQLTAIAVGLAVLIGVPLGILICYVKKLNKPVLGFANVVQAIPSMALLGFAIPFLGIGTLPAVTMVIIYSLLPIIKNTYTGINNISPDIIEAAQGMGLTQGQILSKVQIPLALPVIMAGVRISAVTAVGLMTLAAFIGADGLGYLVFSGIRTVNNNQILAGAIPACALALVVDFFAAMVERLVTPISLQKPKKGSVGELKKMRQRQKLILGVAGVFLIVVLGASAVTKLSAEKDTLVIGSKDFTEQHIIANMLADLIEDQTDITVDRKINLGGTQVCFTALKGGEIDLYVDYSGTAYGDILGHPPITDVAEVYETSKKELKELYGIEVLKEMAFNNTYALAVTQEIAAQYNLKTISDLKNASKNLKSGVTLEFANRPDGLSGVKEAYGLSFKGEVALDGSPRYVALTSGETQVVDAFSTDGLLKKFNLVVLEDDLSFFPPYYAMPMIRGEALQKYPEVEPILTAIGPYLTDEVMMELNYRVDELQENPEAVAKDFLVQQGLLVAK